MKPWGFYPNPVVDAQCQAGGTETHGCMAVMGVGQKEESCSLVSKAFDTPWLVLAGFLSSGAAPCSGLGFWGRQL